MRLFGLTLVRTRTLSQERGWLRMAEAAKEHQSARIAALLSENAALRDEVAKLGAPQAPLGQQRAWHTPSVVSTIGGNSEQGESPR